MTENKDKRFFDFFKNYKTDDKTRQMLESGTNVRVRLSKDPLRIEIYMKVKFFIRPIEKLNAPLSNFLRANYTSCAFTSSKPF